MFTSIDKALVSGIYAAAYILNYTGVYTVSDNALATIAASLPFFVWLIPNKSKVK